MNKILKRRNFLFAILLLLVSPLCYADAGIPMLIIAYPFMIFALIPIIFIESYFMKRKLVEISFGKSLKVCTISNLISTIAGIPLTWGVLLILDLTITDGKTYFTGTFIDNIISVTIGAPWTPEGWYPYAALMFLLIPFFYVSWYIENKISQKILKNTYENIKIKQAVFIGNLYSYLFLELMIVAIWIFIGSSSI